MVRALESIPRLLKPGGYLIDIHPVDKAPLIKIQRGSDLLFAERDPGYDTDESLRRADEALDEIIQRGVFLVDGTREFELVTYASSAAELQDFWEKYEAYNDEPKDDAITTRQNDLYTRAQETMQSGSAAEITYHEKARITRLRPGAKN